MIKCARQIILIYGAHLVALECYRHLCRCGCGNRVIGFAVSDMQDNPDELEGKPVKSIRDYIEYADKCTVVIAMPLKYHDVVENVARNLGFSDFERIGLEDMSALKGDWIISDCSSLLPFVLQKSSNDLSWLDAYSDSTVEKARFKFPTLYHLDIKEMLSESRLYSELYEAELEGLSELTSYSDRVVSTSNAEHILNVFMVVDTTSLENVAKRNVDPWIKPLLVGSVGSDSPEGYSRDDEYEGNLADRNPIFAEMTGAHWIWKMAHNSEYKGLCHYRRFFDIAKGDILRLKEDAIDALLTTPRFAPGGIRGMFIAETPVKEYVIKTLLDSVKEVSPIDREEFDSYLDKCFYFPNNMVIAKSDLYDEYCKWIFPILLRMCDIDNETGYGHSGDRHIAYAAELLTSYFFIKRKHELKIVYTDYIFKE